MFCSSKWALVMRSFSNKSPYKCENEVIHALISWYRQPLVKPLRYKPRKGGFSCCVKLRILHLQQTILAFTWEYFGGWRKYFWYQDVSSDPVEGSPKDTDQKERIQIESTWLWKANREKLIKITGFCSTFFRIDRIFIRVWKKMFHFRTWQMI